MLITHIFSASVRVFLDFCKGPRHRARRRKKKAPGCFLSKVFLRLFP
jgi:hypothetical protein